MNNKHEVSQTLIINDLHVWIKRFSAQPKAYVLFVHGGPGSHSGYFEQALVELREFHASEIGWISYDQRGCGRSAGDPEKLTHDINLKDLTSVIEHFADTPDLPNITAVFGHSYGVNLAYEYFRDIDPTAALKFISVGRSMRYDIPSKRNLMIDIMLLKLFQTEEYSQVMRSIDSENLTLLELKQTIRNHLSDVKKRSFFYWGMLDRRTWYENLQSKVAFKDNDKVFQSVVKTFVTNPNRKHYDPNELSQSTCWIMGMQDFLMGGESVLVDEKKNRFKQIVYPSCGHYPHFEAPERFMNDMYTFLFEES
jgi:pimeloyl-ACP methyl ester carboxylesterase